MSLQARPTFQKFQFALCPIAAEKAFLPQTSIAGLRQKDQKRLETGR